MCAVIVVVFGVMSIIMITDRVVYGRLQYTRHTRNPQTNIVTSENVRFDFVPTLSMIDTITISNGNEYLMKETPQLNNNQVGGVHDPVVLQSEANAVAGIMQRLNQSRRTNAFRQFFTRGESGRQHVQANFVGAWQFEELSEGLWIRLVFARPEFVVIQINNRWEIQPFNPNYTRHFDEELGTYVGPSIATYNNQIITAIHIPLGGVENRFTQQTWHLSVGRTNMVNQTSIGFTFQTFGNYHNLLRFVSRIDDNFLL